MTPKLILVTAMLTGPAIPLPATAADEAKADLRHLTTLLRIQASDDAFEALDIKQDGFIDRLEASRSEWVEIEFDRIDTDGDGRISREEWLNATVTLRSLAFLQIRRTENENP